MKIAEATRPLQSQKLIKPIQLGVAYLCTTSTDGRTDPNKNINGPIFTGNEVPAGIFDDVSHEKDD